MRLYNLQVLQHSNQSLGFITVLANVSTVECFEGVTQMPLNISEEVIASCDVGPGWVFVRSATHILQTSAVFVLIEVVALPESQ